MEDLATRDIQLFIATEDTLLSESIDNLHKKCLEWGLSCEGSKQMLVERLITWRDNYISQPSTSASPQSPLDKNVLNPKKDDGEIIDKDLLNEEFGLVQYCNIPFEDITILNQLGTGSFKDCYRGLYFDVPVAICKFRTTKAKKKDIISYRTELEIYKKTVHPNIVSSYGVVGHHSQLILINEFCSEGDLLNYMAKRPKPSLLKQLVLLKEIAQAVEYLHGLSPKIVHRDLKPDNILIDSNGVAKLTDFGEACIWKDENKLMNDSHGTRNWQAPEYHRCFLEGYTEKVDIFAMSLIFWQVLHWAHDKIPYKYCETGIFASEVSRKQIRPSLKDLESYPKLLLTLIVAMWSPDPKERPTAKYVVFLLKQLVKKHS